MGKGNPERLRERCQALGMGCDIIQKVERDGITISSTYIHNLVAQGEMERAAQFLGHPHILTQQVGRGKGICKFITSNFAEIAFKSSLSDSMTVSPSSVLTGASSTSDMEINISESGTDNPCSHFEMVCRTTFSLTASSCCESPLDFLIAFIFSLSTGDNLLSFSCCHYYRRNCPLPQATYFNIPIKTPLRFLPEAVSCVRVTARFILVFLYALVKGRYHLRMIIVILFAIAPAVCIKRRVAHIEVFGIQPILNKPEGFPESLKMHNLTLS